MAGQTVSIEKKVLIKFVTDTLGAKQAVKAMKDVDGATGKTDKSTKSLSKTMFALAKRAALVAPIWMIVRGAMNLARRAIGDIIGSFLELDKGMRKVIAVTNTVGKEQIRVYGELERRARISFRNTSRSMTEVTEAMYQIGTAGRSTEEILEGFEHVLNLAIGTFGDVATAGKTVSGILNVFEQQLKRVGDTSQQIQYVSDLLAVAWRNNQIELNEVAQSMQYLASEGNVLDISLEELIASSSVLNDAMLRGGKGGRLLARAFVQIAKDSDKLRRLGVLFDPNKPLKYRDIMTQLHGIYVKQKGSLTFLKDLTDIFGTRGKRAITGILTQWEKFNEEMDRTPEQIANTAKELKELAEGDWASIMKRYWRAIWVPAGKGEGEPGAIKRFFAERGKMVNETVRGLESFSEMFKLFGDKLVLTRKEIKDLHGFLKIYSPSLGKEFAKHFKITQLEMLTTKPITAGIRVLRKFSKEWDSTLGLVKAYKEVMGIDVEGEVAKKTRKILTDKEKSLEVLRKIEKGEQEISKLSDYQIGVLFKRLGFRVKYNDELRKALEIHKKTVQEKEKKKKQDEDAITDLTSAQQLQVRQISNEAKLTQLKIQGASRAEVTEQKLLNLLDERNEKIVKSDKFQKASQEDQKKWLIDWDQLLSAGLEDLDKWALKLVQAGTGFKEALKIVKEMRNRIMDMEKGIDIFSDKLEKSFSSAFANLLKGEDTINQFFNNIVDSWRSIVLENISGTLTEELFGFTGVGEQFGGMMVGIQGMFKSPIEAAGSAVERGHIRGGTIAGDIITKKWIEAATTISGRGGAGGAVDLGALVGTAGGAGAVPTFPFNRGMGGIPETFPRSPWERMGGRQRFGAGLNVGMAAYGGYQAAGGGMLGAGAGLAAGGGSIAGLMGHPMIGAGLMVLSTIFGMFNKKTITSIEESEIASSSRLDHINSNLEIINRSVLGKKAGFEPYPFRKSAYFQARPSTGVQVQSINISVGSEAQGQDVVKAIQDEFNVSSLRVLQ